MSAVNTSLLTPPLASQDSSGQMAVIDDIFAAVSTRIISNLNILFNFASDTLYEGETRGLDGAGKIQRHAIVDYQS